MRWQVGWLNKMGLYDDYYALYLPLVYYVIGGPRGSHFYRPVVFFYCWRGFVSHIYVFRV